MSLLAKIFGRQTDPKDGFVPLWRAVVAIAREPRWYAECGVADTQEGRFDMLSAVLAAVIVRMERDDGLRAQSALLTELFVEDIEGQLRQQGIGDPTLGKRMGKLMSALGGRIGAYRAGFADQSDAALADAVTRNVTFRDSFGGGDGSPACVARGLRELHRVLRDASDQDLARAEFAR